MGATRPMIPPSMRWIPTRNTYLEGLARYQHYSFKQYDTWPFGMDVACGRCEPIVLSDNINKECWFGQLFFAGMCFEIP